MSELSALRQALRPKKAEAPKLIPLLHAWLKRNLHYAQLEQDDIWVSDRGLRLFFAMRNESAETALDEWKRDRKVRTTEHRDGLGQAWKLPES